MFARLRGFGARIWASGKSAASRAGWVDWAGLALIAVALVFVGVWKSGHLQEWAPNLATELASIAITIVVVDRIVQRERARRIRPRLESAFLAMNVAVDDFMRSVRLDYEAAGGTAELPWREDGLDALEGWRRHLQDTQAGSDPPGRHDTVVHAALDLSRVFSEIAGTRWTNPRAGACIGRAHLRAVLRAAQGNIQQIRRKRADGDDRGVAGG